MQLVGVDNADETVSYIEESPEREVDHLFHYFQPKLNFKPIPSLLVGWDFPLNPAQFGASQTGSTTPGYIWDQTIMASAANNLTITRDVGTSGMKVVTTGNTDAFYMLQYLDGGQAMETTFSNLSVNIAAYSANMTNVVVRPYLFVAPAGVGVIPTLTTTIGTIASTGIFSLTPGATTNGWVAVPNIYSTAPMAALPSAFSDTGFNGWTGKSNFNFSTTGVVFAIVVTFQTPTTGTQVLIESISCVPGDIPTRPAPQAISEVFRECQYYYESIFVGTNGAMVPMGTLVAAGTPNIAAMYATNFQFEYQQTKRVAPTTLGTPTFTVTSSANNAAGKVTPNLYVNVLGTVAPVLSIPDAILYGGSAYWSQANATKAFISFIPNNVATLASGATATGFSSGEIRFNYNADARLGVV